MSRLLAGILGAFGFGIAHADAQTLIVDASNGPGTNFTTITAAVAAAPSGATLLVRAGAYGSFTVDAKGLTILCDAGVDMTGTVLVTNVAASQTLTIRDLRWSSSDVAPGSLWLVELTNCAGAVHLEGLSAPQATNCWPYLLGCTETSTLRASSCDQLTLRDCNLSGATSLGNSNTSIESCTLIGDVANNSPQTGLSVFGGRTQISGGGLIRGGPGWWIALHTHTNDAVGLFAVNGEIRVLDGTISAGQNGYPFLTQSAILVSGGNARIDPDVTLIRSGGSAPLVAGAGPHQIVEMPSVIASSSPSPGAITATAVTVPGDVVILAIGLPGPRLLLPTLADAFWIDPNAYQFLAVGTQSAIAPVTGTITVPPGFAGLRLGWHAVAFGPVTGFQNSNPSTSLIF